MFVHPRTHKDEYKITSSMHLVTNINHICHIINCAFTLSYFVFKITYNKKFYKITLKTNNDATQNTFLFFQNMP